MAKESEMLFYQADSGDIKIEVLFHAETFWISQKKMSDLFDVQRPAITKHLKNIFESGELVESSVCSILEHTADDGKNYECRDTPSQTPLIASYDLCKFVEYV